MSDQGASSPISVTLMPANIPGVLLNELLEAHAVSALKWWLLCRGVKSMATYEVLCDLKCFKPTSSLFWCASKMVKRGMFIVCRLVSAHNTAVARHSHSSSLLKLFTRNVHVQFAPSWTLLLHCLRFERIRDYFRSLAGV